MLDLTPRLGNLEQYRLNSLTAEIDREYERLAEQMKHLDSIHAYMCETRNNIENLRADRQKMLDETKGKK